MTAKWSGEKRRGGGSLVTELHSSPKPEIGFAIGWQRQIAFSSLASIQRLPRYDQRLRCTQPTPFPVPHTCCFNSLLQILPSSSPQRALLSLSLALSLSLSSSSQPACCSATLSQSTSDRSSLSFASALRSPPASIMVMPLVCANFIFSVWHHHHLLGFGTGPSLACHKDWYLRYQELGILCTVL